MGLALRLLCSLLIDGIAAQAIGIGLFWLVQKRFTIPTKTMLLFVRRFALEHLAFSADRQNGFWILVLAAWDAWVSRSSPSASTTFGSFGSTRHFMAFSSAVVRHLGR